MAPFVQAKIYKGGATPKFAKISMVVMILASSIMVTHERTEKERLEKVATSKAAEEDRHNRLTTNAEYFKSNKSKVLKDIQKLIGKENLHQAVSMADEYGYADDPELKLLRSKAAEKLAQNKAIAEIVTLKNKLDNPDIDEKDHIALYERLAELESKNKEWEAMAESLSRKYERKEKIEKQFSVWDGSHVRVSRSIKKSMNDPESFDHVNTVYVDKGSFLVIETTFRGKNGFNATVLGKATAKVDLEGNVLALNID